MRPLLGVADRARARNHRRVQRRFVTQVPGVRDAIDTLGRRWKLPSGAHERPIFLLAAGWRSGSTMVQRLIMSGGEALIWGEPYARCAHVQRMSEALRALGGDYPEEEHLLSSRDGNLTEQWIASLFPEMADVKAAHRAFFDRLLAEPAASRAYRRWGIREVLLEADHARYLRWLYPGAKLVFLVRNPLASYRSYLKTGPSFARWPDEAVITPSEFGRHWTRLAGGYVEQAEELGAVLLRFEDLFDRSGEALAALQGHIDLTLDRGVLDRPIPVRGQVVAHQRLSRIDRRAIVAETERVARPLGYHNSAVTS